MPVLSGGNQNNFEIIYSVKVKKASILTSPKGFTNRDSINGKSVIISSWGPFSTKAIEI